MAHNNSFNVTQTPATKQTPVAGDVSSSPATEMYFSGFDPSIPSELDDLIYSTADHEILGRTFLKALTLMNQLDRHSAPFLRIQSTVFQNIATTIAELQSEQRNYTSSIEFLREIIKLSPNSDEFYKFYVNLLSEVSVYATEYCEMVVEFEDPNVDRDMGNVGVGMEMCGLTPIRTVAEDVRDGLKELLRKSDMESMLLFMRKLGNGAEDFRLVLNDGVIYGNGQENFGLKGTSVSYRQVTEEPSETEAPTESEIEMEKTTKTDGEELKKRIEVQMAEKKKEIEIVAKRIIKMKNLSKELKEMEIRKITKMAGEKKKEIKMLTKRLSESKKANEMVAEEREREIEIEIEIEKATKTGKKKCKDSELAEAVHLEDLAKNDATKKSKAVPEALLAKGSKGTRLQNESEVVSNVEHLKPYVDQLAEEDLVFDMIGNVLAEIND